MVAQGDIIKISFDPQIGHEQAGYRPAVVVSNNVYNNMTGFALVCPITNTDNKFPLHVPLDERTATTGVILCEHLRSLDLINRSYKAVEKLPDDVLKSVIDIIYAEADIL